RDHLDVTCEVPLDYDVHTQPNEKAWSKAASLALRLLERRYHRPLGILVSAPKTKHDRLVRYARTFGVDKKDNTPPLVPNAYAENAIARYQWAFEALLEKELGVSHDGAIPATAIVYALTPKLGLKQAEMLVCHFD